MTALSNHTFHRMNYYMQNYVHGLMYSLRQSECELHTVIAGRFAPTIRHRSHCQRGLHAPQRQNCLLHRIGSERVKFPVRTPHNGLAGYIRSTGNILDCWDSQRGIS